MPSASRQRRQLRRLLLTYAAGRNLPRRHPLGPAATTIFLRGYASWPNHLASSSVLGAGDTPLRVKLCARYAKMARARNKVRNYALAYGATAAAIHTAVADADADPAIDPHLDVLRTMFTEHKVSYPEVANYPIAPIVSVGATAWSRMAREQVLRRMPPETIVIHDGHDGIICELPTERVPAVSEALDILVTSLTVGGTEILSERPRREPPMQNLSVPSTEEGQALLARVKALFRTPLRPPPITFSMDFDPRAGEGPREDPGPLPNDCEPVE